MYNVDTTPRTRDTTPRVDVVTFDCYGTLIDWERGITEAFAEAAARAGRSAPAAQVLAAFAAIEPEIEAGPYQPYRQVLSATAAAVSGRLGWPQEGDHGFLAESLPSWPPFPDTNAALTRLRLGGVRLGILSNVDEDLLAATRRHFDVAFDLIVTAEQVRSYKPGPAHFEAARLRLPLGARWLHAAQSYFHDVVPAKSLGIPVAWINRKSEPPGTAGAPDAEFGNLIQLADWLTDA